MSTSTAAIIVAAGSSQRMGFDKLLARFAGRPVLAHTISAFEECQGVAEILVITSQQRFGEIRQLQEEYGFRKISALVEGGAERYLSVWNGLQKVDPGSGLIAVHDGARPLITPGQISACISAAEQHRAVASAHPITDTVKRADADGVVAGAVDRENLWAMETPQVFQADLLQQAYRKVIESETPVTDEVSAVELLGEPVHLVHNPTPNPKITFPGDLELAEKLIG